MFDKLEAEILELDSHVVVGEGVVEVEEVDYLNGEKTGIVDTSTAWLDVAGYDELWGQMVEMVGY